jgi:hypothetical protein
MILLSIYIIQRRATGIETARQERNPGGHSVFILSQIIPDNLICYYMELMIDKM